MGFFCFLFNVIVTKQGMNRCLTPVSEIIKCTWTTTNSFRYLVSVVLWNMLLFLNYNFTIFKQDYLFKSFLFTNFSITSRQQVLNTFTKHETFFLATFTLNILSCMNPIQGYQQLYTVKKKKEEKTTRSQCYISPMMYISDAFSDV